MKQPDFGKKIVELRQQKNMTQEDLAELCEVSTRTIQRIESGDVEPRPATRNNLEESLDFTFENTDELKHESTWLVVLHMSNIICVLLIPLLIWIKKRKQSQKINQQGRDVLNFQITMVLLQFTAVIFFLIVFVILMNLGLRGPSQKMEWFIIATIGLLPIIVLGVFTTFHSILNTIRILGNRPYHYPLSISFVK